MATLGPDGARLALYSWQAANGTTRGASPEELAGEADVLRELARSPMDWPAASIVRLHAASEFVKADREFVQARVAELHDLGAHNAAEAAQREATENAIATDELDAVLTARYRREQPPLDTLYPMRQPADGPSGTGPAAMDAYAAEVESVLAVAQQRQHHAAVYDYGMATVTAEQETIARLSGLVNAARDRARLARADAAARQSGQPISPEESRRWQRSDPLGYRAAIEAGRIYVADNAA